MPIPKAALAGLSRILQGARSARPAFGRAAGPFVKVAKAAAPALRRTAGKIKVPKFLKGKTPQSIGEGIGYSADELLGRVKPIKGSYAPSTKKFGIGHRMSEFEKAHPKLHTTRMAAELGLGLGAPAALAGYGAYATHKQIKDVVKKEVGKARKTTKNIFKSNSNTPQLPFRPVKKTTQQHVVMQSGSPAHRWLSSRQPKTKKSKNRNAGGFAARLAPVADDIVTQSSKLLRR